MFATFTPDSAFEDQYNEVRERLDHCRDLVEVDALLTELDSPAVRRAVGVSADYLIGMVREQRQYLEWASGRKPTLRS